MNDQLVNQTVRKKLLDHKSKIIAAFSPSLQLTDKSNLSEAIDTSMELIGNLRRGREPSMYTEVLADGSIQQPSVIVRPVAARDTARLATHCLLRAQHLIANNQPAKISVANDFFFTLKTAKIQEIMNHGDFSDFYLARIERGEIELDEALYAFVNRPAA